MKHLLRLGIVLVFLAILTFPAVAQGPGEGGVIFIGNTVDDPSIFVPLLGGDTTSSDIYSRIYPQLFGVDAFTGEQIPGVGQTLATGWEFDDTGTVVTITLREDAFWSDGTQITANDWIWGVEALRSGVLETPRSTQMWESLDDGTPGSGAVVDAQVVDDFTIEVTFNRDDCQAINDVWPFVVPSHIFIEDFGDDLAAMNDEPRYLPGVYWGPWKDPDLVPGDRVSLAANQDFPDTQLGYVSPSEWVYLNVPDGDIQLERFRAGELTFLDNIPGNAQPEFEGNPDFQTFRWQRLGYVFYAFNHANPANPQAAFDEEGNYIEQEPHPILGDKRVRQAIAMSVDMDAIIENNLGGAAVPVGIPSIPISWDWNSDLLYPLDPTGAMDMLDEAGWVMGDGEFRVCQGCAQAEIDPAYEGTEMALTLNANEGGDQDSIDMIEFIAQSMRDIGINAQTNYIDWGTAFLPALDGQTFDMAILAWSLSLPLDPDGTDVFTMQNDVPGSGFNFGSYHNAEVDQLYKDGRDPLLTDGCTTAGRKPYYDRVNEIMFDELPYLFMYSNLRLAGAPAYVENWNPGPFNREWNEDAWISIQPAG